MLLGGLAAGLWSPAAGVSLTAQLVDGKPTVQRLSAARNGLVLPC